MCRDIGMPIMPPIACSHCPSCFFYVKQYFTIPWQPSGPGPYCLRVAIPNAPTLVGLDICVQNACNDYFGPCWCLSSALGVTIQA